MVQLAEGCVDAPAPKAADWSAPSADAHLTLAAGPAAHSLEKRVLDVAVASLLLAFLAPLLLAIALLVKLDSPGPVLFAQRRAGFQGRTFKILKFRTMTVIEDGAVIRQAAKQDDRVTRVGRCLRRLSFDELPQLINVLRGEMSLVGPRPHALAHDAYYMTVLPTYQQRFRVRPGITGLAQTNGARGPTETLDKMRARIDYDNQYIDSWSFGLDLWLLVKSVATTPFHSDAH